MTGSGPQLEDGYTRIANELMEQVPRFRFNGTQLRIILVIWRYTYGFKRKDHRFALSFLAEATNASKSQVDRELTALIERKVIWVTEEAFGSRPRALQFNKNYDEWVDVRLSRPPKRGQEHSESSVLQNEYGASSALGTLSSSETSTKKERKKTLKKGIYMDNKIQFLDTVFLTQDQYERLCSDFGKETVDLYIEKLDEWQTNNPRKKKKDHNKTLRVWIRKDATQNKRPTAKQLKRKEEEEILNQFYREGEERETNGNSEIVSSNQNRLPPV